MVLPICCRVGTKILIRPVVTMAREYPCSILSFTDHFTYISVVNLGGRYPHTSLVQPRSRAGDGEGGSVWRQLLLQPALPPFPNPALVHSGWGLVLLPLLSSLFCLSIGCGVGFPASSVVKNLPANAGDADSILGSGRFPWRKKWQPTPVFLPGKSHGQSSVAGYSPWRHKRVRHDLETNQQYQGCEVGLPNVVGIATHVCEPERFPAGLCCVFFLLCKVSSLILVTCPGHSLPHFTEREAEAPRGTVSPDSQTSTISALPLDVKGRKWAGLGCWEGFIPGPETLGWLTVGGSPEASTKVFGPLIYS